MQFFSHRICTRLAQSVERPTFNRVVEGSIPSSGAISFIFVKFSGLLENVMIENNCNYKTGKYKIVRVIAPNE